MIKSRKEMHEYIRKDMERNFVDKGSIKWVKILLNPRLCFIVNLRHYEYWSNRKVRDPFTLLLTV